MVQCRFRGRRDVRWYIEGECMCVCVWSEWEGVMVLCL